MRIFIPYDFPNWNEYIKAERTHYIKANSIKQEDKRIVGLFTKNKKYDGKYPIEINFKVHFKDNRKDLDNTRLKGLIDGLVANKVIKNDNLNHIKKITIEAIVDKKIGIEVEINEIV